MGIKIINEILYKLCIENNIDIKLFNELLKKN